MNPRDHQPDFARTGHSVFHQTWFDVWAKRSLRRHFARVQLWEETPDALEPFEPGRSHVYVCNHVGFWDGVLMNLLLRRFRRQTLWVLADAEQTREHRFFEKLGAIPIHRDRPRQALRALTFAAGKLRAEPGGLVVFPQGKVRPQDARPMALESGIARLVERLPEDAAVVPVALRYEFWDEQLPEALVLWGSAMSHAGESRSLVRATLERRLTVLADELREKSLAREESPRVVLRGRSSISKWKEKLPKRRRIRRRRTPAR